MTDNTDKEHKKCTCCSLGGSKGQWWYFTQYNTGERLVSGYYCPSCSNKVYEERKRYDKHPLI